MKKINKIWIVGANGQLGRAVFNLLDSRRIEILSTDIDDVDITNLSDTLSFSDFNHPDVIINCAAFTNIDECEKNIKDAYKVNTLGARNLSVCARKIGARFVHISTEHVFDGLKGEPYNEFDTPNPISVYGKSSLEGENFVRQLVPKYFIIRTGWLYGEGKNFVNKVLHSKNSIKIVNDQISTPTSARELAKFIIKLINTAEYGTYHATCKGSCTAYEFVKEILKLSNKDNVEVVLASKEDYPNRAPRPKNSVLDNFMLKLSGLYEFPDWKDELAKYIKEIRL